MSVKIAKVFEGIKGQERVCRNLTVDLRAGQSDRSYLFYGPRGVGKTMVAMALAKARACRRGGCGECEDCRRAEERARKGVHYGIFILSPKKVQTTVDQVREVLSRARFRAGEEGGRTYIVDNAESLNADAANILLKLVEEPPPRTAFVFVTANREGMLPTLRSRCREIGFQNLPPSVLQELLVKEGRLSPAEARLEGALLEGGFPAGAQRVELMPLREEVLAAMRLAARGGVKGLIQAAADMAEGGRESARQRLHLLYLWFRDLLVIKHLPDGEMFNVDRREELARETREFSEHECVRVLAVLEKSKTDLEANANQKLVFEVMLGKIAKQGEEVKK